MRRLSSVDAQFLAMETPRTYGHVAGLAIDDPSTAPGARLTVQDLRRLVGERIHLLSPFRRRLAPVPLDIDLPYWIEDPDFDLDFHIRESAVPPPGRASRSPARSPGSSRARGRSTSSSPTCPAAASRSTSRARGWRPTIPSPSSRTASGSTSRA